MSKIVCDVCGTAYPETAAQCPICGCARGAEARTVDGNKIATDTAEAPAYQTVKGGRFSKKNVRKRNKEMAARQSQPDIPGDGEEEKTNTGLIVLLLVLLAAVVAVVIYIALTFFGPFGGGEDTKPSETGNPSTSASTGATTEDTQPTGSTASTEETEDTDPTETGSEDVPCTSMILHQNQITLEDPGATAQISVSVSPANTTDLLCYISSNEDVATVDGDGVITAVGEGNADITIQCGDFEVVCHVKVDWATEPTTEPTTEPSTEPSTAPAVTFELNRSDITFRNAGESWKLYNGSIALTQIKWRSDDASIAKIDNGVVTAVGPGTTKVYGEYNGIEVSCIIRCNWKDESGEATTEPATEPTTEPTEGNTNQEEGIYSLYINGAEPGIYGPDVTIAVGEKLELTVVSPSGKTVSVTWTASKSGIVTISGNTITAAASGTVYVSADFNGETFTCIVRVS